MEFAVSIVMLERKLRGTHERIISAQVCRSGTSIGANIREAQFASSRADFVNKLQVALKEANETLYWLELLYRSNQIDGEYYGELNDSCTALLRMLVASINTAKNHNSSREAKEQESVERILKSES